MTTSKFQAAITQPAAVIEAFSRLQGRRQALLSRLDAARLSQQASEGARADRYAWKVEMLAELVEEFDRAIANFSEGLDVEACEKLYFEACQAR